MPYRRRYSGTKKRRHENIQKKAELRKIIARDIVSRLRCKCSGTVEEMRESMAKVRTMERTLSLLVDFMERTGLYGEIHAYNSLGGEWKTNKPQETREFELRIKKRIKRIEGYVTSKIKRKKDL